MSAIQQLHDVEIGGGLAWPEDGKILVYLGCPLDPVRTRELGEALVQSFDEAEAWFRDWAKERLDLTFTLAPPQGRGKSIVQRLFEAGIPGSVYWIYDSAFGMTLMENAGGANSRAEAEAWLDEHAP